MSMKTCSGCKRKKSLSQFYVSKRTTAGKPIYRTTCKDCHKAVMRPRSKAHYEANKSSYFKRSQARTRAIAKFLRDYKHGKVCADCQQPHPYWRLDFDHLPGKGKTCDVSRISTFGWGMDRIQKEIDKCELVCSNCHRDRTFLRSRRGKQVGWIATV